MSRALRISGIVVGSLVGLIVLVGASGYVASSSRINRVYQITPPPLVIPNDSASIAHGKHFATAFAMCVDCHGADLSGGLVADDPAFGRIPAVNLTRASSGVGAKLTDADWVRAIRDGLRPDGTPIPIMPSDVYAKLGDADIAAIIAYAKSVPGVEKTWPTLRYGPIGRALLVAGKLPLFPAEVVDHKAPPVKTPPAGVTVEYGTYLATGCRGCHGPGLSGGPVPGTPPTFAPARDITPAGIGDWEEQDFFRVMREGVRPGGMKLDAFMPYRFTKFMTDDELRAIFTYLKTVPRKDYGNR